MQWVSVNDRLPKDREAVLWLHDKQINIVGYYIEEVNLVLLVDLHKDEIGLDIKYFTHWTPLPEPPEDEKNAVD